MPRVVVIGSINTDLTVCVPKLPLPGQTVLGGGFVSAPGGKGANQAAAALRAGAEVVLIAAVGDDALGRAALARYRDMGIDVDHVRVVADAPSGVALISVADGGENMIAVAPGANARLEPDDVANCPDLVFAGGVLLASLEVPLETVKSAMIRARKAGMVVLLNPAPVAADRVVETAALLEHADFVTPNRLEARALAGIEAEAEFDPLDAARRLLAMGPRGVVVTLGSEGSLAVEPGGWRRVSAPRVRVVDSVGAGDAYTGALAVALAEGESLFDAAVWAGWAAAVAVTRAGAQEGLPTRLEIDRRASEGEGLAVGAS